MAYENENEPDVFAVVGLLGHRAAPGGYQYFVLWEPCEDNAYHTDEKTWQSGTDLVHDGLQGKIDAYWAEYWRQDTSEEEGDDSAMGWGGEEQQGRAHAGGPCPPPALLSSSDRS